MYRKKEGFIYCDFNIKILHREKDNNVWDIKN
jgi:hypothetical protein